MFLGDDEILLKRPQGTGIDKWASPEEKIHFSTPVQL
jgi:hypothetical protein